MGDDAAFPEDGVFINRISGTAHQCKSTDAERSACGVWMNPLCFELVKEPYALFGCTLCWRSGCAQWIAKPEDLAIPEDTKEEDITGDEADDVERDIPPPFDYESPATEGVDQDHGQLVNFETHTSEDDGAPIWLLS